MPSVKAKVLVTLRMLHPFWYCNNGLIMKDWWVGDKRQFDLMEEGNFFLDREEALGYHRHLNACSVLAEKGVAA